MGTRPGCDSELVSPVLLSLLGASRFISYASTPRTRPWSYQERSRSQPNGLAGILLLNINAAKRIQNICVYQEILLAVSRVEWRRRERRLGGVSTAATLVQDKSPFKKKKTYSSFWLIYTDVYLSRWSCKLFWKESSQPVSLENHESYMDLK